MSRRTFLQAIAAMSLKLVDVVRRFKGDPSEDVNMWMERYETAVRISLPTKSDQTAVEAEMTLMMPLFLEGPAYRTWKQLSTADRGDLTKIKIALNRVYGVNKSTAWEKLKAMRLMPGEHVDVLADQVKCFLEIIVNDTPPDELVSLFVIDALPTKVAEKVKMDHGELMQSGKIISCAKSLLSGSNDDFSISASAMNRRPPGKDTRMQPAMRCAGCQRWGHTQSTCRVQCYGCGERGHIRRNCVNGNVNSGNGSAGVAITDRAMPAEEPRSANSTSMGEYGQC